MDVVRAVENKLEYIATTQRQRPASFELVSPLGFHIPLVLFSSIRPRPHQENARQKAAVALYLGRPGCPEQADTAITLTDQ